MKKNHRLRASFYGLAILSVLLSIIFLVIYQFNSNNTLAQTKTAQNKPMKERVKFFNKTNSFQIINSKVVGQDLRLSLKNNYDKSINGFYATLGSKSENTSYAIDLVYSEIRKEIPPNETFTFPISLEEKPYTEIFTLHAVLFADGSSEGDLVFIQEMKDQRRGEEVQLSRGLSLLKSTRFSQESYQSNLEEMKAKISSLSTTEETESPAFKSGMSFGKDRLIRYLDEFANKTNVSSVNVEQNKTNLESKLESLILKPKNRVKIGF